MELNVQLVFVLLFTFSTGLLIEDEDHLLLMKLSQDIQEMKLKQAELTRENTALKALVNGKVIIIISNDSGLHKMIG